MIELAIAIFFFIFGYMTHKGFESTSHTAAGRFVVYRSSKGDTRLCVLAQRYCNEDDLAVVTYADSSSKNLPFVIGRENLRFYTSNGDAINDVNWKDVK